MSEYLTKNCNYWSQAVYDNPNPESYVFRIYGRILKHQFGLTGSAGDNLLDFGCGSGGNARFFDSLGFNVYGVDQSQIDIDRCHLRLPHKRENFKIVDPTCNKEDNWFGETKFKIVTSFQVLYYLNETDLENRLISLYNTLEGGGIFIATMMHASSWYYGMSEDAENGMRHVKFYRDQDVGRDNLVQNDHYINFTYDEQDLRKKFKLFKPLHTKGYYDGVYRDDQGSEKHLVFIGQK